MSHPSRVRGLKYCVHGVPVRIEFVAPFTGAWIEIAINALSYMTILGSHPSRVRGLKLQKNLILRYT